MPKPRSKRQAIREERKKKKHDESSDVKTTKKRRLNDDGDAEVSTEETAPFDHDAYTQDQQDSAASASAPPIEREFFGTLSDEEQEYFRSVDEQLDIDDFQSQEDRDVYLANVFTEARGKELKLACSQSCSRLTERLILMSNTRQKKRLFEQFSGHFLNLIQHRFASHCCETLFLQSAPVVTRELSGERDDEPVEDEAGADDSQPLPFMEELFLLTLDELEGQLSYLITDRFASHTLRALLIILSGRPLEQSTTKSLIHSKKKEKISVPWTSNGPSDGNTQLRAVPASFTLATKKIISDTIAGMSPTELRVLATHPTGNPVLQLFLELDISLSSKDNKADDATQDTESEGMTLLWRLLPGAPGSLKDSTTPASDFVNSMLYEPIGSRLLETVITHCPGKLFKALNKHIFAEKIQSLLRNDIASYPAMRVLNRLSKEDLVAAVDKTLPEFPKLVALSRYNVIKTLFERCQARQAKNELGSLVRALVAALGGDPKLLVPKLCQLETAQEDEDKKKRKEPQQQFEKKRSTLVSHGSHLVTGMLAIPGAPAKAVQKSLTAMPAEQLLQLATSSAPTSHVLADALASPAPDNKVFHKSLIAPLRPHVPELAVSEHGNKVLCAIVSIPSRSSDGHAISLPFHFKESIMAQLGHHEQTLRDSFEGRKVWRAWKGDLWRHRRNDWVSWLKEVDADAPEPAPLAAANPAAKTSSGGAPGGRAPLAAAAAPGAAAGTGSRPGHVEKKNGFAGTAGAKGLDWAVKKRKRLAENAA